MRLGTGGCALARAPRRRRRAAALRLPGLAGGGREGLPLPRRLTKTGVGPGSDGGWQCKDRHVGLVRKDRGSGWGGGRATPPASSGPRRTAGASGYRWLPTTTAQGHLAPPLPSVFSSCSLLCALSTAVAGGRIKPKPPKARKQTVKARICWAPPTMRTKPSEHLSRLTCYSVFALSSPTLLPNAP